MINKKLLVLAGILWIIMLASNSVYADDTADGRNWQGLYVGFTIGDVYGKSNPHSTVSDGPYFATGNIPKINSTLGEDFSGTSPTASVLVGYDFKSGNLIYGIEADLTGMNYSETKESNSIEYPVTSNKFFSVRTSVESNFTFSIRPKIGYSFGNTMVNITAGPAVSLFKYKFNFTDTAYPVKAPFSDEKIVMGISSSIGVNLQIGNGWSLRGNYVFNFYPNIVLGSNKFSTPIGLTDEFTHDTSFLSHNIRIGLIKQF